MRVTSDLWVAALLRRVFASGGFAAVVKRGFAEAGAIFVLSRNRCGETALLGPAAQTSYDTDAPETRMFALLQTATDGAALELRLQREQRFDPDIWIVEIETGQVSLEELIPISKP